MKESYGEGSAHHIDPESCVSRREAAGEALTGARTGQPLSCEIRDSGMPTLLSEAEGNIGGDVKREPPLNPAQSKTLRTCGNSLHGNWEIPWTPATEDAVGRPGKVLDLTPGMNVHGKSDGRIVPEKSPNKGGGDPSAEAMEGRRPTKGNTPQTVASRTRSRPDASPGLRRVREAARKDKLARFTALLHHVSLDRLRESFHAIKREAAPGVDGVTWTQYEENLEDKLKDLHARVHRGTYRARPSRRVYIPKTDGRMRSLGIAALEDKIVQRAVGEVLGAIYEEDFLGFSYGFRPGRGQHDALDALYVGMTRKKVNWMLDADIQGFFDNLSHEWMVRFIEHRVADPRMLRLIRKWLRAGVSEDGQWSETNKGVPQGAVISPLLANVYLHYVLDLWVNLWRTKHARGEVVIVRYADDFVMGFQYHDDAERFLVELKQRLEKFGLALHPEKTRLIGFGRFAARDRQTRGEGKPETFDFLGFTHMCGKSRERQWFIVRRKTMKKRLRAKLAEIKQTLLRRRHEPVAAVGAWLQGVVRGYYNYHAIPGNKQAIQVFRTEVCRHWLHALRRRSQRHRMNWDRFAKIVSHWIPYPRIMHPMPYDRFFAKHPR